MRYSFNNSNHRDERLDTYSYYDRLLLYCGDYLKGLARLTQNNNTIVLFVSYRHLNPTPSIDCFFISQTLNPTSHLGLFGFACRSPLLFGLFG